jgi:sulfur-carrier protein adenylyltransferase/sulfurtransferase
MKKDFSYERYNRQVILKGFGLAAQQKLAEARVLVVGAGGLGCPALQYLAAAGVGTIGIWDDDIIELSNLHRQPLYTIDDIGKSKAMVAAERLGKLNPEITIHFHARRLTSLNGLEALNDYDIIVDGTDNFPTRYLINDACVQLGKPFVYGAVSSFEGQVSVFNAMLASGQRSSNYRDLFPEPPTADEIPNCSENGVLGILPGMIGILQATEVIKLITGIGRTLANRMVTYNALDNAYFEFEMEAGLSTLSGKHMLNTTNDDGFCETATVQEIDPDAFNEYLGDPDAAIIDVREFGEQPVVTEFDHQKIPLSILKQSGIDTKAGKILLFCQSGQRSRQAASFLSGRTGRKIFSLRNGIVGWKHFDKLKRSV